MPEYEYNTDDNKNTNDDGGVQGAKELLYKTTWRTEAIQIPLDSVQDTKEKELIIKCVNQDDIPPEELPVLEHVLQKYRPAIQKQKPLETIENYEKNAQHVLDEHEFLKILDEEEKVNNLTFYYPLHNGKEAVIDLTVKPLRNAQAIMEVTENLKMFMDYTEEETKAFNDYQAGKAQTPEEIAIAKEIQLKLATANANRVTDAAIEFLAIQTKFKDSDSSYEDMKKIYSKMNVAVLLLLFKKVQDITNLSDVNVDRIFR